jgi:hypothetical protein
MEAFMTLEEIIDSVVEDSEGEVFSKTVFAGIADITIRSIEYGVLPEKEDTEINPYTVTDFLSEAFSETDLSVFNEKDFIYLLETLITFLSIIIFEMEIATEIKRKFFSSIKTISNSLNYGEKEKSFKMIDEDGNFVKSFAGHMVFCLGDVGLIFSHEYFLIPFITNLQELVASSVVSETYCRRGLFSPLNVTEVSWRLEKGEKGSIFIIVTRKEISEFVGPPRKRATPIRFHIEVSPEENPG